MKMKKKNNMNLNTGFRYPLALIVTYFVNCAFRIAHLIPASTCSIRLKIKFNLKFERKIQKYLRP